MINDAATFDLFVVAIRDDSIFVLLLLLLQSVIGALSLQTRLKRNLSMSSGLFPFLFSLFMSVHNFFLKVFVCCYCCCCCCRSYCCCCRPLYRSLSCLSHHSIDRRRSDWMKMFGDCFYLHLLLFGTFSMAHFKGKHLSREAPQSLRSKNELTVFYFRHNHPNAKYTDWTQK